MVVGKYSHLCEWCEYCTKMFHAESPSRLGDRLVAVLVCGGLVYPGVSPSCTGGQRRAHTPQVRCGGMLSVRCPVVRLSLVLVLVPYLVSGALARKIPSKNTPQELRA